MFIKLLIIFIHYVKIGAFKWLNLNLAGPYLCRINYELWQFFRWLGFGNNFQLDESLKSLVVNTIRETVRKVMRKETLINLSCTDDKSEAEAVNDRVQEKSSRVFHRKLALFGNVIFFSSSASTRTVPTKYRARCKTSSNYKI